MAMVMAQAQWDDMLWVTCVDQLLPLGEIEIEREIDIDKTDDSEGKPPVQIVRFKNDRLTVHFDAARMTGTDPRNVFDAWYAKPGIHAPFYLNGWQLGEQDMLLVKVSHSSERFNKRGLEYTGSFDLEFEGWFEEGGMKSDLGRYATITRGVADFYAGNLVGSHSLSASQSAKLAFIRRSNAR